MKNPMHRSVIAPPPGPASWLAGGRKLASAERRSWGRGAAHTRAVLQVARSIRRERLRFSPLSLAQTARFALSD
jgi:hypothetical protein